MLLPPANEVWGKVIVSQVSVILFTGGACVGGGVHGRGACMVRGVCMAKGVCVW